ncbi:hypothetical protein ACFQH3_06835 [Haladaptatus sp. GCM10025707]|uniref:hypothetical protein n=1 Tax=unclassified Haladaptatus TaxID=2622732 RepID=UPI0023E88F38|nr:MULTISPECIES: hypothetical protein [unclassified Haladaptatus]
MDESTLTGLSQRDEAFWIGLALWAVGIATPQTLELAGIGLGDVLAGLGMLILTTRILVGSYRILKHGYVAWRYGYAEGKAA